MFLPIKKISSNMKGLGSGTAETKISTHLKLLEPWQIIGAKGENKNIHPLRPWWFRTSCKSDANMTETRNTPSISSVLICRRLETVYGFWSPNMNSLSMASGDNWRVSWLQPKLQRYGIETWEFHGSFLTYSPPYHEIRWFEDGSLISGGSRFFLWQTL